MSKKQLSGEIVTQYLEQWPNLNSLTLAKLIYKENPEVWTSVDNVRTAIRYYRGSKGDGDRRKLADKRFVREPGTYNVHCIPESDEEEYTPFRLPQAQNNILFMSDLHIPYHEPKALDAAFEYGIKKSINTIILGGDILDCYQLSTWVKDPRRRNFSNELDTCKEFLDSMQEAFPNAVVYFMQGNHEERLEKYLKVKAPELFGIPEFRLDMLLNLGERGIHWIQDRRYLQAGKLKILPTSSASFWSSLILFSNFLTLMVFCTFIFILVLVRLKLHLVLYIFHPFLLSLFYYQD